jgi:hypothetical protein
MTTNTPESSNLLLDSDGISSSSSSCSCYVLYVDHQGHPAPLDESYHATASRRLSSAIINRGYPSTVNNVDSAYCPQCLTVYTELGPGAINNTGGGYFCSKPACKLCPFCLSVASIQFVNNNINSNNDDNNNNNNETSNEHFVVYGCGNCGWSSDHCNLQVPVASTSSDEQMIGRVELTRAVDELQSELTLQKRNTNELYEQYWAQVTSGWAEESRASRNIVIGGGSSRSSPRRSGSRASSHERYPPSQHYYQRRGEVMDWSIEALEESLKVKKQSLTPQFGNNNTSVVLVDNNKDDAVTVPVESKLLHRKGLQIHRVAIKSIRSNEDDNTTEDDKLDKILAEIPLFSYQHQALNNPFVSLDTPSIISSSSSSPSTTRTTTTDVRMVLMPLLIPLRLRTSRRCRMELNEGRPGILLKPKLNPLEGDSSLRTGQGQWYKKDCSAIAIIPRVDIVKYHKKTISESASSSSSLSPDTVIVFLIKVSNPTLGTVRLRFTASSYCGETPLFSNDDDDNMTTTNLPDLVVDTSSRSLNKPTIVNAILQTNVLHEMPTTETVELLSAEDSIIELGASRAREVPIPVLEWDSSNTIESCISSSLSSSLSSMKLVARSSSDAWFELTAFWNYQGFENIEQNVDTSHSVLSSDNSNHLHRWAFPIALQVDLGNGSWDSSLIPPDVNTVSDHATFDVVLVC